MPATPLVSYCVTCMNRLWQLGQTLGTNLANLRDDEEICLVDYNSADGLWPFIREHHAQAMASGKLRYYRTVEPRYFNMSKAKNTAHALARGQFVFNLDADNFLNDTTRLAIDQAVAAYGDRFVIHEYAGSVLDGTHGRVCMPAALFWEVGAYDESFPGMGCQDCDLIRRTAEAGAMVLEGPPPTIMPLRNTQEDKMRSCDPVYRRKGFVQHNASNAIKAKADGRLAAAQAQPHHQFPGILNCRQVCDDPQHASEDASYILSVSADWEPLSEWEQLIERLPDRQTFLEIGSFEGRSALQFFPALNPGGTLYCVDPWAASPSDSTLDTHIERAHTLFVHNATRLQAMHPDRHLVVLGQPSAAALSELYADHYEAFDFIFVDGAHDALSVMADGIQALRLLRRGGILLFDNYYWQNPIPAGCHPRQAIDAFRSMASHVAHPILRGNRYAFVKTETMA